MIALEVDGGSILALVLIIYIVGHSPAIILLIIGLRKRKTKPERAKKLFIIAGIYFLIGAGVCGALIG